MALGQILDQIRDYYVSQVGFVPVQDNRMETLVKRFAGAGRSAGWTIETASSATIHLAGSFTARFAQLPPDYSGFLRYCTQAVNAEENIWFNCQGEFNGGAPELAFPWNAFELMSLEAAEGDAEWSERIRRFWDLHVPAVMGVEGDYQFLAVELPSGAVVHGVAPEFEEVSEVASSFTEYLDRLTSRLETGARNIAVFQ